MGQVQPSKDETKLSKSQRARLRKRLAKEQKKEEQKPPQPQRKQMAPVRPTPQPQTQRKQVAPVQNVKQEVQKDKPKLSKSQRTRLRKRLAKEQKKEEQK